MATESQLPPVSLHTVASILLSKAIYDIENVPQGPRRRPALVWGAPGVGKSAIVNEVARRMAEHFDAPVDVIDFRLSTYGPEDIRGIPDLDRERGVTTWYPPETFPSEARHSKYGILFLDEIFLGNPSCQNLAMQLTHDKCVGEHPVPENWIVLAASNRTCDRASVSSTVNSALLNRFAPQLDIVVDHEEWCQWATAQQLAPEIIALISFRPELLVEHPDGVPKGKQIFATPRTWEAASDILKLQLGEDTENACLQGTIGVGAAAELTGFVKIVRNLPDIKEILANPSTAPTEEEPGTQYALATLLARRADHSNFQAVITYLTRIASEFAVLAVRIATERDPSLKKTQAFADFKVANQDLFND